MFSIWENNPGLWRPNIWSEFDRRLNEWTWGGTGIWTWMWVRIGVGWLQSRPNCWFCGRMGYNSNSFASWTNRFTFNWTIFFLRVENSSWSPQVHLLGGKEAFLVIIASHLTKKQEEDLLVVLRDNKETTGWTIADIKGLSPSIVQHRIHLIEEAKSKRDPQRRLNPIMQETVRVEILKLLDNEITYPTSNSQWVSPVHAVPKKAGL